MELDGKVKHNRNLNKQHLEGRKNSGTNIC